MKVDNITVFSISMQSYMVQNQFVSCMDACMFQIIAGELTTQEVEQYSNEIKDILIFSHLNGYKKALIKLSQTGIFLCAIGKMVEITDDEIIYTTEY